MVTPSPTPLPTPISTPDQTPLPTPTSSKTLSGESITDDDEDKNQVPCPFDTTDKKPTKQEQDNAIKKPSSLSSVNSSDTTVSKVSQQFQKDNDINMDRISKGLDKRATFMIRNIPNKYTQVSTLLWLLVNNRYILTNSQ